MSGWACLGTLQCFSKEWWCCGSSKEGVSKQSHGEQSKPMGPLPQTSPMAVGKFLLLYVSLKWQCYDPLKKAMLFFLKEILQRRPQSFQVSVAAFATVCTMSSLEKKKGNAHVIGIKVNVPSPNSVTTNTSKREIWISQLNIGKTDGERCPS